MTTTNSCTPMPTPWRGRTDITGNSFAMGSGRIAYAHGAARSGDDGRHRMLVRPGGDPYGLPQPARRRKRHRAGRRRLGDARTAQVRLGFGASACCLPTGRCHAFDVAADGFVAGEGCAVVLLKRLPDALRDGDRILAVMRGTAANQDGHTVNIVTPSRTHRSRPIGRRWPRRTSTPAPSAWSRRTAPAPRSATRSNTPAWPRCTASTGRARSHR